MQGFAAQLDRDDIAAVVDFVRDQFMQRKAYNTRYHTVDNGWPDHDRKYAAAYPFALGEIAVNAPLASLTPAQQSGWRLFMQGCVSCHDRGKRAREGAVWKKRPLSYPRNQYSHQQADSLSGASVYQQHDVAPSLGSLTTTEQKGRALFNANCAFCHGRDGSGQNWIGSYVEPSPRDLRQLALDKWSVQRIEQAVAEGVNGSAMPAWKHVLDESQIRSVAAYVRRLAQVYTLNAAGKD